MAYAVQTDAKTFSRQRKAGERAASVCQCQWRCQQGLRLHGTSLCSARLAALTRHSIRNE